MKEKFEKGTTAKLAITLQAERKRLELLAKLKVVGGPFTNAEEVDQYMKEECDEQEKQRRMKMEIIFARECSTRLPKTDPLFKIQVAVTRKDAPLKKRRDKNAEEFCLALKTVLGKQVDSKDAATSDQFRNSLLKFG